MSHMDEVIGFLSKHPGDSFTVSEIAKELDMVPSSISSVLSSHKLPSLPVKVAFTVTNHLGKEVRHLQYDPLKELVRVMPKSKPIMVMDDSGSYVAVKKPKKAVRRVRDDEMFAKVLDRVGDEVVLKLSNGDIVKGRVMR